MGRIADALRSNLRELARSDARSLRGLDAELRAAAAGGAAEPVAALAENLEQLTVQQLKARCRAAGLSRYSQLKKTELVALLGGGTVHSDAVSSSGAATISLEERLQRLEALLRLVAEQVGVPSEQIVALLEP